MRVLLANHPDAAAGLVFGGGAGSLVAASAPHPDLVIEALRWLVATAIGVAPVVIRAVLEHRRAKKDALAELKRERAARMLADGDPLNNASAERLLDEADELDADARAAGAAAKAVAPARGDSSETSQRHLPAATGGATTPIGTLRIGPGNARSSGMPKKPSGGSS